MKKRLIASLAIIAVFGITIAAYAYTQSATAVPVVSSCCKKGDSCPMKSKGHDDKGEHAKMSCCKKHSGDQAKTEGACCDCCGDSCPMRKDAAHAVSTSVEGKGCCDDCACCKRNDQTA